MEAKNKNIEVDNNKKIEDMKLSKRIIDLLVYFKYYLPDKEYKNMMEEIQVKLEKLKGLVQPNAFDNIRGQMGIKSLEDLEILKNLPKKTIKYHSFDKEN